ncbi:hypothetical protein DIPPA_30732 [Diplonema papillatum]|nr:hypothetical protein DIPPA_30732 [Diplonema papillatum]
MLRVTIGRACRVKAAGSMCGEGTAAAQVSQTGGRSPLDSQARYATRVGFWKKHRHLRNPEVRIRRPTMMSEDTRSMGMVFFHWHWMYTIRYWKKKFNELLLHKVTEYELQNEHIPKGKSDVVVRAMLRERKGIPFYNDDPLTFRDNPFAKVSTNWQFERERETELTASLMGRLQYRMKMEGISLEEARRQQADMRQRHRAKKTDLRKGKFQKIIDYRLKGRLSTHADEMSTVCVPMMAGTHG